MNKVLENIECKREMKIKSNFMKGFLLFSIMLVVSCGTAPIPVVENNNINAFELDRRLGIMTEYGKPIFPVDGYYILNDSSLALSIHGIGDIPVQIYSSTSDIRFNREYNFPLLPEMIFGSASGFAASPDPNKQDLFIAQYNPNLPYHEGHNYISTERRYNINGNVNIIFNDMVFLDNTYFLNPVVIYMIIYVDHNTNGLIEKNEISFIKLKLVL